MAITGHANIENALKDGPAPNKGKEYNPKTYEIIKQQIKDAIRSLKNSKKIPEDIVYISGMARGVDEIYAIIAMESNSPLILSIPNSIKWHSTRSESRGIRAQALNYHLIMDYVKERVKNGCALSKIIEVPKTYAGKTYAHGNEARNQHMMNISDGVISYKSSTSDSTGTNDGIEKAKSLSKYIGNVPEIVGNIYKYEDGDLYIEKSIDDGLELQPTIIAQGCNTIGVMGAGLALYLKKRFPKQAKDYKERSKLELGKMVFSKEKDNLYIANLLTQSRIGNDGSRYVDYEAVETSVKLMMNRAQELGIKEIRMPLIGSGLAGGEWSVIQSIIKKANKNKINIIYYEIAPQILEQAIKDVSERSILRGEYMKIKHIINTPPKHINQWSNKKIKEYVESIKGV